MKASNASRLLTGVIIGCVAYAGVHLCMTLKTVPSATSFSAYGGREDGLALGCISTSLRAGGSVVPNATNHLVSIQEVVRGDAVPAFGGEVLAVAYALYQEARGESYAGKLAVASVIYNRAHIRGLTFSGAVFQPHQFAVDSGTDLELWLSSPRNPADADALKECLDIAGEVVNGLFTPSGRWTHFHSGDTPPTYFATAYDKQKIGGHWFYIVQGEY